MSCGMHVFFAHFNSSFTLGLHVYLVLFKVIGIYEKNMSNHSFHGEG